MRTVEWARIAAPFYSAEEISGMLSEGNRLSTNRRDFSKHPEYVQPADGRDINLGGSQFCNSQSGSLSNNHAVRRRPSRVSLENMLGHKRHQRREYTHTSRNGHLIYVLFNTMA
jgi:hypothetical protein